MSDPTLLRFLELASRELDAVDTRAVIGGREPGSDRVIWAVVEADFRIEAEFAEAPLDPAALTRRLQALIESFFVLTRGKAPRAAIDRAAEAVATRRLDAALADLADRAGAAAALVIDAQSPVIWGLSFPREALTDIEGAWQLAAADPDESAPFGRVRWLVSKAIATVRPPKKQASPHTEDSFERQFVHGDPLSFLCRPFATIYALLLIYDGDLSELRAEGTLVHALPNIERLVFALPPIEPPPGGKAIRLPYLRPL